MPIKNPSSQGMLDFGEAPFNMLPYDGETHYYGSVLPNALATHYFNELLNEIPWEPDRVVIKGKPIVSRRKVALFADDAFKYSYSQTTKIAKPWTPLLVELKAKIEQKSNAIFNACLLNLYHDGTEGLGWHSDNEKVLVQHSAIASLSLGAERRFSFKHKKTGKLINLSLSHGSLLVMRGTTQTHWLHSLPTMRGISSERINLTFRLIDKPS